MNIRIIVALSTLLLTATTASFAKEATPAWQEPDFVMEEIVVTGHAPTTAEPAHRAEDPAQSRMLRALHRHRLLFEQLRADAAGSGSF